MFFSSIHTGYVSQLDKKGKSKLVGTADYFNSVYGHVHGVQFPVAPSTMRQERGYIYPRKRVGETWKARMGIVDDPCATVYPVETQTGERLPTPTEICAMKPGRGGTRTGAGRKPNADKDLPVRSVLSVRLTPEYLAYAEQQVTEGRFRSVGEYVESLINGDMVHRQLP